MAYKVQKPCRVCGKMYTPCSNCENDKSVFHWRTVACSVECGREYFKRVEESRMTDSTIAKVNNVVTDNQNTVQKKSVTSSGKKESKKKNIEEREQIE